MNLGKLKGSLAKSNGRIGIFDSGPSDRDLADQIGSAHNLIGAVDSGSNGSGRRASGRRRESPATLLRGGRSPECCDSGVPGLDFDAASAYEHLHGMSSPPGHSGEGKRARDGVLVGEGVSGRRTSPAWARSRGSGGLLGTI